MKDAIPYFEDVVRRPKMQPDLITNLFHRARLWDELCTVVSGRRLVPESYAETIAHGLRRKGKMKPLRVDPAALLLRMAEFWRSLITWRTASGVGGEENELRNGRNV